MSAFYNSVAPDYVPRGTQTLETFDPYAGQGWFANADRAMVDGLYGFTRRGAATIGLAGGALIRGGELAFGAKPEISDAWFDYFVRPHVEELERLDADAASYGLASQVLHGLLRFGSEALIGGPAGVFAAEFGPGAAVEAQRGKDTPTALKLSGVRAGASTLAVALPFTLPVKAGLGPAVVQRLGYGVGSNTVLGISSRAMERKVLIGAGYEHEAPEVLDPRAVGVDVVLGAFFGLAGHGGAVYRARGARRPPQELVDAAMTQNLKLRDEDAAPKAPQTPGEMLAHTERMTETLDQLAGGAVQQSDGVWVPRQTVDALDPPPIEVKPELTAEEQMHDLLEREAIQAEAEVPPEVQLLDRLANTVPEGTIIPDENGNPVQAKAWLDARKAEALIQRDPEPTLAKIVDCALRAVVG